MPKTPETPEDPGAYAQNLELLSVAKGVVEEARETRQTIAKRYRKGNTLREAQVALAVARIQSVMAEVRRETARLATLKPIGIDDYVTDFVTVSDQLQRERRKLWKMQWRPIDQLDWAGPPPLVVVEQDEFSRLVAAAKKSGYRVKPEILAATT